jgi:hypothetical protein
MSETSRERIARNQAAYRKINEGIRAGRGDSDAHRGAYMCECAILGCNELIELTLAEDEAVRRSSRRFVIAKGHDLPDASEHRPDALDRHDAD